MISEETPPMSNNRIEVGLPVGELAQAGHRQRRFGLAVDDFEIEVEALLHLD